MNYLIQYHVANEAGFEVKPGSLQSLCPFHLSRMLVLVGKDWH